VEGKTENLERIPIISKGRLSFIERKSLCQWSWSNK